MNQVRSLAASVCAMLALAACSDVPNAPSGALPPTSPNLSVAGSQDAVVPGEILLKVRNDSDLDAVVRGNALGKGAKGVANAFTIVYTERGNERAMAARLASDPRVEFAEPNYIRQPFAVNSRLWAFSNPGGLNMKFSDPTDTRYGTYIPSSYASTADADMDADFTVTCQAASCPDIVIGNIDTGVDFNNAELAGRLIAGHDYIDNDNDPSDIAAEGHGTHTAGTSAGANISAVGVTGISSHVKFWASRVCGTAGCPSSAIVNAMNDAAAFRDANGQPMVALNVSLGGGIESTAEANAIKALTANGTLVIASAGNDGRSQVSAPASDANAISVAASTWQDALASYSNYGKGLDLTAPGGNCYSNTTEEGCIFSSIVAGYTGGTIYNTAGIVNGVYENTTNLPLANNNYAYMQGTSMAAPNVTSTAAVVAWATGLRGSALRNRLQSTADDKGTAGYDTKFGNGRVNVYRAVNNTATSPL